MVKVRLARHGSKKRPYYHVVVTDSEKARNGRSIEQLGTYDPKKPMAEARLDRERLNHWLGRGAQPSERCAKIILEHGKALAAVAQT